MRIVDIVPRRICIKIELSEEECASLEDFFEKGLVLYAKVYSDSVTDERLSGPTEFKNMLTSVLKSIKKETENGT